MRESVEPPQLFDGRGRNRIAPPVAEFLQPSPLAILPAQPLRYQVVIEIGALVIVEVVVKRAVGLLQHMHRRILC